MGTGASAANYAKIEVNRLVQMLNNEARARANQGVNELQTAAYLVLSKDGTGRTYKRKSISKRGNPKPIIHTASVPGQPPAPDEGNLRSKWRKLILAEFSGQGAGIRIKMRIKSDMPYSVYLEKGTRKMAARPFKKRIRDMAMPAIKAIYANW